MKTIADNIDRLREYMKNNIANIYPIENHPLAIQDEYMKRLYLKMLCTIVQYNDEVKVEQLLLLQRIISGSAVEGNLQDYMRMALDSDKNFLEDFINAFNGHQLQFPFVVDCLVLVSITGEAHKSQLEFISELSQQLQVTSAEFIYIALLAQSIIEQDHNKYQSADELRPSYIDFRTFYYFTKDYVKVFMSRQGEDFFISFSTKTLYNFDHLLNTVDVSKNVAMHQRSVYLENMVIETEICQLLFENSESVHIRNCEFIGSDHSILFKHCNDVKIENCIFRNFSGRTIIFEDIVSISMISCTFIRCKYTYHRIGEDWKVLGGVLYSERAKHIKQFIIDSCEFKECGGSNLSAYHSSAVISNCATIVKNSKFISCWNRYATYDIDPENSKRTLFLSSAQRENNEIISSANFS